MTLFSELCTPMPFQNMFYLYDTYKLVPDSAFTSPSFLMKGELDLSICSEKKNQHFWELIFLKSCFLNWKDCGLSKIYACD